MHLNISNIRFAFQLNGKWAGAPGALVGPNPAAVTLDDLEVYAVERSFDDTIFLMPACTGIPYSTHDLIMLSAAIYIRHMILPIRI